MATNASLSNHISETTGMRYALALLATLVALLARLGLNPFLGDYLPYITLFPAAAFCAWYCGVGPSILSVVVAVMGAKYWFIPPTHSLRIVGMPQIIGILIFLSVSGVLLAMGEARRRQEQVLWAAQRELGEAVKERTVELDKTNQNLRELSARLMQLQDDERRRIARELHDSVGQMLAALGMNLAAVGTDIERLVKTANTVNDSAALVQELSREVRTISHLLHPPLLDEAGLASALHWYVEGFAERSKIKVDLEIPADFERLGREAETAIFRTVQECLTNIHRHSETSTSIRTARVRSSWRGYRWQLLLRVQLLRVPPQREKASGYGHINEKWLSPRLSGRTQQPALHFAVKLAHTPCRYCPVPLKFSTTGVGHLWRSRGSGLHCGYVSSVTDPLMAPVCVGVKLTVMLHFPPCLRKHGDKSPASEKSPLVATLRTRPCSTSLPVTVTVFCDVVPMFCDGKTSDVGANVSSPTALPEVPMTCGLVGSLSVMVTAPG